MTCVVGVEESGIVYIGGDSAAVTGDCIQRTKLHKVFRRDKFLIGYTTSFRMGQLLQYNLAVEAQKEDQDDLEYMATTFVNAVRQCLKDGGFAAEINSREEGGAFLVGYNGRLYEVCSDYQVNRFIDGFGAVGSGYSYALGSLFGSGQKSPKTRIEGALEAAAHFNTYVCGPYCVEFLYGNDWSDV